MQFNSTYRSVTNAAQVVACGVPSTVSATVNVISSSYIGGNISVLFINAVPAVKKLGPIIISKKSVIVLFFVASCAALIAKTVYEYRNADENAKAAYVVACEATDFADHLVASADGDSIRALTPFLIDASDARASYACTKSGLARTTPLKVFEKAKVVAPSAVVAAAVSAVAALFVAAFVLMQFLSILI